MSLCVSTPSEKRQKETNGGAIPDFQRDSLSPSSERRQQQENNNYRAAVAATTRQSTGDSGRRETERETVHTLVFIIRL